MMADYKLYIKGTRYQICKKKKDQSATCGFGQKYNTCVA